jgi:hypothetical protein
VIWKPIQPEHMPLWARDIQYLHESLDPVYNSMGLESLLRLRDHQDKYKAAVAALAARIVEVCRSEDSLRPLIELPKFQTLHNAFAEEGNPADHAAPVRIVVAALDKHSSMVPGRSSVWYGDTPEEWCPYRDGQSPDGEQTPVALRAAAVAGRRVGNPRRALEGAAATARRRGREQAVDTHHPALEQTGQRDD